MKWVLLSVGCAECVDEGDPPLIVPCGDYDSMESAKAAALLPTRTRWKAHPAGGMIATFSDGAMWAAPVSAFKVRMGEWV